MKNTASYLSRIAVTALLIAAGSQALTAQQSLNSNCTVSVLNRSVRVNADGSWVLPNIPANFGQVKARATCVENGVTTFGESDFFTVAQNVAINLPHIIIGPATPIPVSIAITPGNLSFTTVGQTIQLTATATYPDGSTKDVSSSSTGTNYTTSNSGIASVSANGLITAVSSGVIVLQATNDGAAGIVSASVLLSSTDSDGDGIPDASEVSLGLDSHNPIDAQEDFDRDGLTNLQEFQRGTDLRKADTDSDGLKDGEEVKTYLTNPLLADTDGDGIPDGIETQVATNPNSGASYDLRQSVGSSVLQPPSFVLTTNILFPNASQLLSWKVTLIDGKTTLDLTKDSRTTYSSNNLNVCNFGAEKGRIFAGSNGSCIITITNGTLSVSVPGVVQSVSPASLSFVDIPGFANSVDVSGNYAYVAAGSGGLQVVDVSNHLLPHVVASLALLGSANDVRVVGNVAYVASGGGGLRIVNITNPLAPTLAGSFGTSNALDVVVNGNRAYVVDGTSLVILNVTSPSAPALLGSLSLAGAQGVDIDTARQLAVVARGTSGLSVVNVANPASPALLSTLPGGNVIDVAVSGNFAFLADFSRSFTSVDLTNAAVPVLRSSLVQSDGGLLQDVRLRGNLAASADVFFVNGVPIVDVSSPANPAFRFRLDFTNYRDDNGTGIAIDDSFIYLTAAPGNPSLLTRLYIGQYRAIQDSFGVPPTVQVTAPTTSTSIIRGSTFTARANATDDVGVGFVSFLVNGQLAGTVSTAPYVLIATAPAVGTTFTLGASATDLGGNTNSTSVTLNLIADPLTNVIGKVMDSNGLPLSNVPVSTLGHNSNTGSDGSFQISGIPTIQGSIVVTATYNFSDGSVLHRDSASVPPVIGGTTDVGTIIITSPPSSNLLISTIAGNNTIVEGGSALSQPFVEPTDVVVDSSGNLYVAAPYRQKVYKITPAGVLTTFAGTGVPGFGGDGGSAILAQLMNPKGLAIDSAGNIYIAEPPAHRVRKVTPAGIVSTVAGVGNGLSGFAGDGGPAVYALFNNPSAVAVDTAGNLYIADEGNRRIRKVGTDGKIITIAGNGIYGYNGDGILATSAQLALGNYVKIAVDTSGNVYVTDVDNNRVRKISGGIITTVAGNGTSGFNGDNISATSAQLAAPKGLKLDSAGNLYISVNNRVRRVSSGVITTIAGTGVCCNSGDGGLATSAQLNNPVGLAFNSQGNLFISDAWDHVVRKITNGVISTVVNTTYGTYGGDNGPALIANFATPGGLTVDSAGNIYVADTNNHRVRRISPNGIVTTVAGTGYGVGGDGGPATQAQLGGPQTVRFDSAGNMYIAEQYTNRIRKITPAGIISTIAGSPTGAAGFGGDNGPATSALLSGPQTVAIANNGDIYIADQNNYRVRKINSAGVITTIAGNGTAATAGDGGPAIAASLNVPSRIALDSNGNLYIASVGDGSLRKVVLSTGIISTATYGGCCGIAIDEFGNLYAASFSLIDKISPNGTRTTIAGFQSTSWPFGYSGDGGPALNAAVVVNDIAIDPTGRVLFTDWSSNVVRRLSQVPDGSALLTVDSSGLTLETYTTTRLPINIRLNGQGTFTWSAVTNITTPGGGTWLSLSSAGGTGSTTIDVIGNAAGLSPGTYVGRIVVSSPQSANGSVTVPVTLIVRARPPIIALDRSVVYLNAGAGANPPGITLNLSNSGPGSLNWTAVPNSIGSWLTVSPSSGTDGGSILVGANASQLAAGGYAGTITITSPGAANSPLTVPVVLRIGAESVGPYTILPFAGQGVITEGGPALTQPLPFLLGVAVDAVGNVYTAARSRDKVYKITPAGVLTTLAGTGLPGNRGDGGAAGFAELNYPQGLAYSSGSLYIADGVNHRVRKVDLATGIITTVAGTGAAGFSGDNGVAIAAQLNFPSSVAVDHNGNLYITDQSNQRVRKVAPNGIISTVAGTGIAGFSGDNTPAITAQLSGPNNMAVDSSNNLFIIDSGNNRVRKVNVATGIITTVAGNGSCCYGAELISAQSSPLNGVYGLAIDASNQLYLGEYGRIRKVDTSGVITTFAGNGGPFTGLPGTTGDGGQAINAPINNPFAITFDSSGTLFFSDFRGHRVRKISTAGIISTIAGNGTPDPGNGGLATATQVQDPQDVTTDAQGNVYWADTTTSRVIRVSQNGTVTTIAGTGVPGYSGDGGPAASAQISAPHSVAVDAAGNVFISDVGNGRIRKVSAADGSISTVAGTGSCCDGGDGGPALLARLNFPMGLALDGSGNIYIADRFNHRIRKVSVDGTIATVAGNGSSGFSGDLGLAVFAQLSAPEDVAVDSSGNLYISDNGNGRVRMVSASTQTINTVGTNQGVGRLHVDAAGNLRLTNFGQVLQGISGSAPLVRIAGNGSFGYSGNGGAALSAYIGPTSITGDVSGNIYIGEIESGVIRRLASMPPGSDTFATTPLAVYATTDSGSAALTKFVTITFAKAGSLSWSVSAATISGGNWLSISSGTSGSGNGSFAVTMNPGALSAGDYQGTVTISSPQSANSVATVPVYLHVAATPLTIGTDRNGLYFSIAAPGGSAANQQITIKQAGPGPFNWNAVATSTGNWLAVSPGSGSGTGSITVSLNTASLSIGIYQGTITVSVAGAINSPIVIPVALTIGTTLTGPPYTATTIAGIRNTVEGGSATSQPIGTPYDVARDSVGNTFIASRSRHKVYRVDLAGVITSFAGTGMPGFSGDGNSAVSAQLNNPMGLAVDSTGNVYIADAGNHRIRRVSANGVITTVAGNGNSGFVGDSGPATMAALFNPVSVAIGPGGIIYIADQSNQRIRRVGSDGKINTVAGNGTSGFSGDNGPATSAMLSLFTESKIAVDAGGALYIADTLNHRVRKVASGTISTIAGTGVCLFAGDNGPAVSAQLCNPRGVAVDAAGNVFIMDSDNRRVRQIGLNGTITTIAGGGNSRADDIAATSATIAPFAGTVDFFGNLYVTDTFGFKVRKISGGFITTTAGLGIVFDGDGDPAISANLSSISDVVADRFGNIYVADGGNGRVRAIAPDGTITTVAGGGVSIPNNVPGTSASLANPQALAIDGAGRLYISDHGRIMRLAGGIITTLAGSGTATFSGDGELGTAAQVNIPRGLAVDAAGNIYIADTNNNRLRKLSADGIMSTIAGNATAATTGDGGPATSAQLNSPFKVAVDSVGNIYVATKNDNRVRKIALDGTISSLPITGGWGIVIDASDIVYASTVGSITRMLTNGTIEQLAGLGVSGYSGDGVYARMTAVQAVGLGLNGAGEILFSDDQDQLVRKLVPSSVSGLVVSPRSVTLVASSTNNPKIMRSTITIRQDGTAPLNWTGSVNVVTPVGGNWLTLSAAGGSGNQSTEIVADPTNLPAGIFTGYVTINSAQALNSSNTVTVTFVVLPPMISANPSSVTATSTGGSIPTPQQLSIINLGPGTFSFTAAASVSTPANGTWLSVSPSSGANGANLTVSFAPVGLAAGTYTGTITISSATVENSPYIIPVTLNVAGIGSNPQLSPNANGRIVLLADSSIMPDTRGIGIRGLPPDSDLQAPLFARLKDPVRPAFGRFAPIEQRRIARREDLAGGYRNPNTVGP